MSTLQKVVGLNLLDEKKRYRRKKFIHRGKKRFKGNKHKNVKKDESIKNKYVHKSLGVSPLLLLFSLFSLLMQGLRVASLNINGGRDAKKRAVLSETIQQKRLDVVFLQETHTDSLSEIDWGLWWGGQHVFFLRHPM